VPCGRSLPVCVAGRERIALPRRRTLRKRWRTSGRSNTSPDPQTDAETEADGYAEPHLLRSDEASLLEIAFDKRPPEPLVYGCQEMSITFVVPESALVAPVVLATTMEAD